MFNFLDRFGVFHHHNPRLYSKSKETRAKRHMFDIFRTKRSWLDLIIKSAQPCEEDSLKCNYGASKHQDYISIPLD